VLRDYGNIALPGVPLTYMVVIAGIAEGKDLLIRDSHTDAARSFQYIRFHFLEGHFFQTTPTSIRGESAGTGMRDGVVSDLMSCLGSLPPGRQNIHPVVAPGTEEKCAPEAKSVKYRNSFLELAWVAVIEGQRQSAGIPLRPRRIILKHIFFLLSKGLVRDAMLTL
jgi:hypothetical protein